VPTKKEPFKIWSKIGKRQSIFTFDNALSRQEHHHGQCGREDEVLARVQQGK
jgi:hypothetical protein